ncbi:hydrogenase maturation nickel metallochaperone HypA [Planctomycetaceae bacterium SH139]
MHEFSVIRSLLNQLPQFVPGVPSVDLREIFISVGPLSGIEPLLAEAAFEQLRDSAGLGACRLTIEHVPLLACCGECQQTFEVESFRFVCPHCESSEVQITSGDAVIIKAVRVVTSPENAARGVENTSQNH